MPDMTSPAYTPPSLASDPPGSSDVFFAAAISCGSTFAGGSASFDSFRARMAESMGLPSSASAASTPASATALSSLPLSLRGACKIASAAAAATFSSFDFRRPPPSAGPWMSGIGMLTLPAGGWLSFFFRPPFGDGGRSMATPPAHESCLVPGNGSSAMLAAVKWAEIGCWRSLLWALVACCTSIAASCIGDRESTSVRSATMFSFTSLLPARACMTRILSLPNSMTAASSAAIGSVMSLTAAKAAICSAGQSSCNNTPTGGKLLRITACFGLACSPCGPEGPPPAPCPCGGGGIPNGAACGSCPPRAPPAVGCAPAPAPFAAPFPERGPL
mmetsp:Transcript_39274/g.78674  ORF Transcript_39274/g.78674 Transcript_39274/m.78674 type:complete len:331 (-) Transcript_39274:401-1393(-)